MIARLIVRMLASRSQIAPISFEPTNPLAMPASGHHQPERGAGLWPNQDPIGKRLKLGRPAGDSPWFQVVRVTRDIKVVGLNEPTRYEVYRPLFTVKEQLAVAAVSCCSHDRRTTASSGRVAPLGCWHRPSRASQPCDDYERIVDRETSPN
jgi:hypothetical protein